MSHYLTYKLIIDVSINYISISSLQMFGKKKSILKRHLTFNKTAKQTKNIFPYVDRMTCTPVMGIATKLAQD